MKYYYSNLCYDSETGTLLRLNGKPASHVRKDTGYVVTTMKKKQYRSHRLIWFIVHGYWPSEIDHINGDKADNRLVNIRECSSAENQQNRKAKGYTWHKESKKWQASIGLHGKIVYLGLFDSETDARAAYEAAKSRIHTFNPTGRLL